METSLETALVLLATAVVVVVACRQFRLPPLIGYLLVGIAVGPHAVEWLPDDASTRHLGEFGVVFLMFSIGLEFSLPKLMTMRLLVFGLGGTQVLLSLAAVVAVAQFAGLDWKAGVALGGAVAMSSTAILGKLLTDRLELGSTHGRQIMGVLLFQDLAVVPLLIVLPTFAQPSGDLLVALGAAALKISVSFALLLGIGQRIVRPWFSLVAAQKSAELFVLNVLLFTLLLAWMTEEAGLSLALGAFIAGMLISETEFRIQVEEDIKPFRDILLGLFFVSVGALLDLHVVWDHVLAVVLLVVSFLLGKSTIAAGLARLFRADAGVAVRVGLALAGAGEFGFVLLSRAGELQIVPPATLQIVLAAMLVSMLLSPFIVLNSDRLVSRWVRSEWMQRAMALHDIAVKSMGIRGHVIVCGFGRSGQNLARILEQEAMDYIALDLDPARIREASIAGESVVFGDAGRREVLMAAGLTRAAALVITYADTHSALRILGHVRELRPELPVVVRTVDDTDIDVLLAAGAAEVVAEIMEGSLMLASHALMLLGIPLHRVLKRIRATREQRYSLFRGFYRGESDESDTEPIRLHSVLLPPGSGAIGRRLEDLNLQALSVELTAIRRRNIRSLDPTPETAFVEGDVVVLRGRESDLALAEARLLQG
ncbi:MAG: cation:proton antiporter [Betaproteobacteria bacterium]|nr:cation:proton antiporter [Betaproteobacteria bacterium]